MHEVIHSWWIITVNKCYHISKLIVEKVFGLWDSIHATDLF